MASFRARPPLLALPALADAADIVLESLPAHAFRGGCRACDQPRVACSCRYRWEPFSITPVSSIGRRTGARILVPTGALLGLDAVRAAAEGKIASVRMVTRKPPAGLAGAPLLRELNINLDGLKEPRRVFEGSAREAIAGFPANVNVAVALSLAGIGPDQTRVEIWADPTVARNTHTISVISDSADLTMRIENIPSEENPRTGRITALSALAALRRLTAALVVGT